MLLFMNFQRFLTSSISNLTISIKSQTSAITPRRQSDPSSSDNLLKITIHLWFWPECVTAAFYSHTNPLLHRAASGWSFSRSVLNLSCAGSETVRVCVRIVEWKALEDVGDVSGYDDVSEKRGREREMARTHDRCRCHMSGIVFLYAWSS